MAGLVPNPAVFQLCELVPKRLVSDAEESNVEAVPTEPVSSADPLFEPLSVSSSDVLETGPLSDQRGPSAGYPPRQFRLGELEQTAIGSADRSYTAT